LVPITNQKIAIVKNTWKYPHTLWAVDSRGIAPLWQECCLQE
jgi:hypothetical protein